MRYSEASQAPRYGKRKSAHLCCATDTQCVLPIPAGDDFFGALSATRMSANGVNLYDRTYDAGLVFMCQQSDGTFMGAGTSVWNATAPDFYLVHTDALGMMDWQRYYGTVENQVLYSAVATPDGGYLLGGSDSLGAFENDTDSYVIKVNAAGETVWTRHYDTEYSEYVKEIHVVPSGGYALLIHRWTTLQHMLLRISSTGDSLWSIILPHQVEIMTVAQDGGFAVAGFDASHTYLTKFASDTAPAAPLWLTIGAVGTGLLLRWWSVADAVSYRVYSAAVAEGPFLLDLTGTYMDTTWNSSTTQHRGYYQVRAVR